jgi:hypothetical protein
MRRYRMFPVASREVMVTDERVAVIPTKSGGSGGVGVAFDDELVGVAGFVASRLCNAGRR